MIFADIPIDLPKLSAFLRCSPYPLFVRRTNVWCSLTLVISLLKVHMGGVYSKGTAPGEICYDISKGKLDGREEKTPEGATTLRLVNPKGVTTMPTILCLEGITKVIVDESCHACTSVGDWFLAYCVSIQFVELEHLSNCTRVGDHFLYDCSFLQSVTLDAQIRESVSPRQLHQRGTRPPLRL